MDFNATIDLIIRELDEAAKIIEDVRNYREVPVLHLELARAKCRNAAEVIRLLKDVPEKNMPEKDMPEKDLPEKDFPRKQTTPNDVFRQKPDASIQAETEARSRQAGREEESYERKIEPAETEIRIRQTEREEKEDNERKIERTETETRIKQAGREKKEDDKITIADSFSPRTDSVIEKLGIRKEEDDMRSKIKSKPIHSLSEAIGINDKFLFVRELFQGDTGKYNKAVSALENTSGFEEARKMIMDYAGNDEKNEAAKQLIDLVKRKFSADE